MGLFEDLKATRAVENAETTTLKQRFATLEKAYQSALNTIEALKAEQFAAEDCYREELSTAQKEICSLKRAFTVAMEELKHTQKQKAAITANRNHWKRECEAADMLYHLADEELSEMKEKQKLIPLRMSFTDNSEEMKIAANIVPAIGR